MPARPMKNPPHVGDFIRTEVIEALGLTVTEAAKALDVTRQALNNLVNEKAALTEEMAIRIETAFGPRAEHLMRMQLAYDMAQARMRLGKLNVRQIRPEARLAADSAERATTADDRGRSLYFVFEGTPYTVEPAANSGARIAGQFRAEWKCLVIGSREYQLQAGSSGDERVCPDLKMIEVVKALRLGESDEDKLPKFK